MAPPGTGKCLGLEDLVLLHDGSTRPNKDLVVGDLLMGPDGLAREVLASNRGRGKMFRIVPEDEQSWTCNGPHIL
ncbi:Hint domain-containing homing endonuclease, partial [Acinetobacter baumannii]